MLISQIIICGLNDSKESWLSPRASNLCRSEIKMKAQWKIYRHLRPFATPPRGFSETPTVRRETCTHEHHVYSLKRCFALLRVSGWHLQAVTDQHVNISQRSSRWRNDRNERGESRLFSKGVMEDVALHLLQEARALLCFLILVWGSINYVWQRGGRRVSPSTIKMTRVMCIWKHNDTMNARGRHKITAEPPMQDSF